jgi:murein DD-endopeptidase MepM/ murein hydrolase activator NlpD
VVGIIAPNWDRFSELFITQDIPPETLVDPEPPLYREAGVEQVEIDPVTFDDPSDNMTDITVYEEVQVPGVSGERKTIDLTKTFSSFEHIVAPGENVSVIANKFSVTMESVIALNGLKDATILPVGKKLKIPNMDGIPYTVIRNDTISKLAVREKISENAILDANDLSSDRIYVGQVLFLPGARMNSAEYMTALRRTPEKPMINPVSGRMFITSNYGNRLDPVYPGSGVWRFHEGIDIRGAYGVPVKAAMAGVVEEIGSERVLGNFIILNHNGYRSLYAHLSAFSVRKGARVSQGQQIGKIGDSGYTTGSHLHFAVYDKNGNSVNPLRVLR